MRLLAYSVLASLFFTLIACGPGPAVNVTEDGYTIERHEDLSGPSPKPEDYVYFEMDVYKDDGELIQSLRNLDKMPVTQMPAEAEKTGQFNPLPGLFALMSVGDSFSMIVPVDSIKGLPPKFDQVDNFRYDVVVKEILDKAGFDAKNAIEQEEKLAKMKEYVGIEEAKAKFAQGILADYKGGKLGTDLQKDPSGLEYIIHKSGDGEIPQTGDRIKAHYYGIEVGGGTMFDNSYKRAQEFSFTLGKGEVIKGWDVGFGLLPAGSEATLFIPYEMAYGEQGRPPSIPAKAQLMFYVEVK